MSEKLKPTLHKFEVMNVSRAGFASYRDIGKTHFWAPLSNNFNGLYNHTRHCSDDLRQLSCFRLEMSSVLN